MFYFRIVKTFSSWILNIMEKEQKLLQQRSSYKQHGRSCQIYIHFAALIWGFIKILMGKTCTTSKGTYFKGGSFRLA